MSDQINFSESVILPREDFIELQTVAFNQPPTPVSERFASTVQTTFVFAAMSGAVVAGCYGWAKAMDWLEEKNFQRKLREKKLNDVNMPK